MAGRQRALLPPLSAAELYAGALSGSAQAALSIGNQDAAEDLLSQARFPCLVPAGIAQQETSWAFAARRHSGMPASFASCARSVTISEENMILRHVSPLPLGQKKHDVWSHQASRLVDAVLGLCRQ